MKENTFTIDNLNLSATETKEMLMEFINHQIEYQNRAYLAQFEINNSVSKDQCGKTIKVLKEKRDELKEMFKEMNSEENLELSFAFNLKVPQAELQSAS